MTQPQALVVLVALGLAVATWVLWSELRHTRVRVEEEAYRARSAEDQNRTYDRTLFLINTIGMVTNLKFRLVTGRTVKRAGQMRNWTK